MDKIKSAFGGNKSKRQSGSGPSTTTSTATPSADPQTASATAGNDATAPAGAAAPVAATNVKVVQPIKLYSHAGGPNPWKVAIIMNELNVPYQNVMMDFGDLKKEPFESVNPNGRVPAIEDPNTGATVWESGAIIEYLLELYDTHNKLSPSASKEKIEARCWFHMQLSGQGPYFGQRAWFKLYAEEKPESVLERYGNEIKRVIGVLDSHLKKTGNQYLTGPQCTYADLAFVPWHWLLLMKPHLMGEDFASEWERDFPQAWAWNQRMQERESVTKAREERKKAMGQ